MKSVEFWAGGLATYRLTMFVVRDVGPFGIFQKFRRIAFFQKWAKCSFCVSPYAAGLVCVLYVLSGVREPAAIWIVIALGWSAITIALDRSFSSDIHND